MKEFDDEQELKHITFYNLLGFEAFEKLEPNLQNIIKKNYVIDLPDEKNILVLNLLHKLSENLSNFQKNFLAKNSNIPRKSSDTSFGEKETKNLLCHIDSHILQIFINEPELVNLNNIVEKIDEENCKRNQLLLT